MARPNSGDSAKRMLAILHLLTKDSRIPLATLASMLGVSDRVIEKDLEKLAMCGTDDYMRMPIYNEDGVVVVHADLPALDRPIRLSAAEARALLAALDVADIDEDDPLVKRLLDAVAVGSPDAEQYERIIRTGSEAHIGDILKTVALALEQHRVLSIDHRSADAPASSQRFVEPLQLVTENEVWYLEAFCRRSGELRVFRVDRIKDAALTDEVFPPRELSLASRPMSVEGLPTARIRLSSKIDPSDLTWPGLEVETRDEKSSVVVTPYAGHAWISRQIVSLLGEAEVLEPAELRVAVARLATEIGAGRE